MTIAIILEVFDMLFRAMMIYESISISGLTFTAVTISLLILSSPYISKKVNDHSNKENGREIIRNNQNNI